jgi:hypothetical protein
MRTLIKLGSVLLFVACASSPKPAQAPAAETSAASEPAGTSPAPTGEHEPEIVHTGKARKLTYEAARERYDGKGRKCGGDDSPEEAIGEPDQRNEMQVGRDHVVTYGFRFKDGTLMIRCKNDHVETVKTIGHH